MKEYALLGKNVPKKDAWEKVTGTAQYVADMKLLNMLHGAVKLSEISAGRIVSMDTSAAKALPGVVCVLTAKDLKDPNHSVGSIFKQQPVFAYDLIRRKDDIIAAVAAETRDIAREAVKLIKVEYEEWKPIFDPVEAMQPEARSLYPGKSNVASHRQIVEGDVEEAFKNCDVIVENQYSTAVVQHMYIEPEACLAQYDPRGEMTIWGHAHTPFYIREEIAHLFHLPLNKVRAIVPYIGGSFGGKGTLSTQCHCALLSYHTGCPVKIVLSREESSRTAPKRHPIIIKAKTGATKDGKLQAAEISYIMDSGCYDNAGTTVAIKSLIHSTGPYNIPNLKITGDYVYTNNPPGGAFKGFGVPQVVCCHEGQMDALAQKLAMDPWEIRKINAQKVGSKIATGMVLSEEIMPVLTETIEAAEVKMKEVWPQGKREPSGKSKKRGLGFGCGSYGIGYPGKPNPSSVFLEVNFDGTVYLRCGALDFGQGSLTVFSQLVAEILGIEYEDVYISLADTGIASDAGSSSSSRQSFVTGTAFQNAARQAKEPLTDLAAELLDAVPANIEFKHRFIYDKSNPDVKIGFKDLMMQMKSRGRLVVASGTYNPRTHGTNTTLNTTTFKGDPFEQIAFGTAVAEVEVDTETGRIDVIEVVCSHDIGRTIYQFGVEGQIEGSVAMGLGQVLLEKTEIKDGLVTNPMFSKYILPTTMDMPKVHSVLVETEPPSGRLVPKGIGEPAIIPIMPAIVSAVEDAIGIRFKNLPLSPTDVLLAIKAKEAGIAK